MLVLPGVLAVAGYQNRDKLGAMLTPPTGTGTDPNQGPTADTRGQPGGLPDGLRDVANNLNGGQSEKALWPGLEWLAQQLALAARQRAAT